MRAVAVVAILLSFTAAAAFAQAPTGEEHRGGGMVRQACKADIERLCSGVQPGGGRIRQCLRANKDKLSEGCKSAIAAAIQARRERKQSQQPTGQQPAPGATTP